MHIALAFYGRINKFREHYNNIFQSFGATNTIDIFFSCDAAPENDIKEFIGWYKPKKIINDKIAYMADFGKFPGRTESGTNIHNMTCHFINKRRVYKLIETYAEETKTHYDWVVVTRLDLFYFNTFNFAEPDKNTIYIPAGSDHTGLNDQIAMGNMAVMKKYCDIFNNTFHLLLNKLAIPHPETLNFAHIMYQKIDIFRVPIKYEIRR
jgi:hypothetical protein